MRLRHIKEADPAIQESEYCISDYDKVKGNWNSIFGTDTIFSLFKNLSSSTFWKDWCNLILLAVIVAAVCLLIKWFLGTTLGLSIRATGDSPAMVRASSINPIFTITVGLCCSNALTGLAGCLIGQYNKTCDINTRKHLRTSVFHEIR